MKKKICFFSGDITRSGGTERVTLLIIQKLKALEKYDISILSIVEQKEKSFFEIPDEIKKTKLDSGKKWIAPGPEYLPLVPRFRHFLKNNKIDILIDVDVVLDLLSVPASTGLKTKIIAWEHFNYHYIWPSKMYQKFRHASQWFSARNADFIITITRQDQKNYENKLGRRNAIQTIHNPMMPVKQSENALTREKSIITAGRLTWVKGIDLLEKLLPMILKKYPDWKWYVLGEGEERPRLEAVQKKYQLENQLILTGNVSNVSEYMQQASIYVMTSRSEGLPMVLLEAAQNGLPMVSFDIQTGPSEIIEDGKNGFLIPPFSIDRMREKVEYLIMNEEVRDAFSKNTSSIQKRFDADVITARWERLLDRL